MVFLLGEFGRTPKINKDAGRDHWSFAMSVLTAGGGTDTVTYAGAGGLQSVKAGHVVLACWHRVIPYLTDELVPDQIAASCARSSKSTIADRSVSGTRSAPYHSSSRARRSRNGRPGPPAT